VCQIDTQKFKSKPCNLHGFDFSGFGVLSVACFRGFAKGYWISQIAKKIAVASRD
jgi:hypothetical protein